MGLAEAHALKLYLPYIFTNLIGIILRVIFLLYFCQHLFFCLPPYKGLSSKYDCLRLRFSNHISRGPFSVVRQKGPREIFEISRSASDPRVYLWIVFLGVQI